MSPGNNEFTFEKPLLRERFELDLGAVCQKKYLSSTVHICTHSHILALLANVYCLPYDFK